VGVRGQKRAPRYGILEGVDPGKSKRTCNFLQIDGTNMIVNLRFDPQLSQAIDYDLTTCDTLSSMKDRCLVDPPARKKLKPKR
jgi:hypothetical protein